MFEDPSEFNDTNFFPRRSATIVLQEYNRLIKYGEKELILDVGSGSGNVTEEILLPCIPYPNFRLVGVDKLKPMVHFANNYVTDPRISFRVLDISEKDESILKSVFLQEELKLGFSKVFSFNCIHWTKDYLQTYKNIFRLMRPGGQMFVMKFAHSTLGEIWNVIYKTEKWQPYLKVVPIFNFTYHDSTDVVTECTDLLKKIGFEDIICEVASKPMVDEQTVQPPWRKVMEYIDPYIHLIPKDLCSEYMDDVMAVFTEYRRKTDGIPFDRVVIIATKPL